MHCAAEAGKVDAARILLTRGARIDSLTEGDCHTPLHVANLANHSEMIQFLLQHGASTHACTTKGHAMAEMPGFVKYSLLHDLPVAYSGHDHRGQDTIYRVLGTEDVGRLSRLLSQG